MAKKSNLRIFPKKYFGPFFKRPKNMFLWRKWGTFIVAFERNRPKWAYLAIHKCVVWFTYTSLVVTTEWNANNNTRFYFYKQLHFWGKVSSKSHLCFMRRRFFAKIVSPGQRFPARLGGWQRQYLNGALLRRFFKERARARLTGWQTYTGRGEGERLSVS